MKYFNIARKYGSKIAATGAALGLAASAHASADPVADMFAAVNLTTVVASVAALGLIVMAITMTFKAIDLAKRGVKKV